MNRRYFISAVVAGVTGSAGCLGSDGNSGPEPTATAESTETEEPTATEGSPSREYRTPTEESTPIQSANPDESIDGPRSDDDLPKDADPEDGYPPEFDVQPAERSIDTAAFDTVSVDPEAFEVVDEERDVPLAPIDAAYYWYARGEARFVDARNESQYELAHVYGAVSNYALDELDPAIEEWPDEDRIICYCGCPHALSSIRGATLLEDGYEEVYVIDEGFGEWYTRDYPMAGSHVDERPSEYLIEGVTDPSSAGNRASVSHEPTDQVHTDTIDAAGRYAIGADFDGVSIDSAIAIETPEYRVEMTLGDALGDVVESPRR